MQFFDKFVKISIYLIGAVAQMGERCIRIAKVRGSIPLCSTRQIANHFNLTNLTNLTNLINSFIKDLDLYFYGPNFWQAGLYQQVADLNYQQALWKPSPERNCIWEIVLHLNSWKWFAVENLKGNKIESMKEHNWPKIPENPDEEKWRAEVEKMKNLHEEFKELFKKADSDFFDAAKDISNYTREIIYHDCYHSGQIGLLRALQGIKAVV